MAGKTVVSIVGDDFHIDRMPTYQGRSWEGHRVEGLLLNARLAQSIFDDRNPQTVHRWTYPDSKKWDAGELEAAKATWTKASKLRPTGPTGHPAQSSADSSAQQGADLLKLIDYRQRKSELGKFAFVKMPHIHQGYNNCGSTACATFARFQGSKIGGWDFKHLTPSPLGTGKDWGDLLNASKKIGQKWKLITFTPDDTSFDEATTFLKSELDAGRPVVVDFKYIGPQYPGGSAGHTLNVCGYLAEENLYILCNPAVATPGLQLITAADLKDFWRSDHYGSLSEGILSRPAFAIEMP